MSAGQANSQFKAGGFTYISKETHDVLLAFDRNDATSKTDEVLLPCRVWDKVSPDLQPFCVSYADPERPSYYAIHRNGKILYEPEYDATNPNTFDEDASYIYKSDAYFQGFGTFESYNLPNHFAIANTTSKQMELREFQDTEEFRIAASFAAFDSSKKGELFHPSCV